MEDLSAISGLPISLDGWRIIADRPLHLSEPAVRRVDDMRETMLDPNTIVKPAELYFMYRDVCMGGDDRILQESGLRYDITVIRAGLLGREYVKTAGHYHPLIPGKQVAFPEVYEVLHGTARYLMQKLADTAPESGVFVAEDVVIVEANAGDKVVMLPGYGHITINPGHEPLVMSNWVARGFSSIYEPMIRTRGGAYYLLNAPSGCHLVANGNYEVAPEPRFRRPAEVPELGLISGVSLRKAWEDDPDRFQWLNDPSAYEELIEKALI